jgi:hypothetical protein
MSKNDSALSSTTPAALEVKKRTPAEWAKLAFPMQRKGGTDAAPRFVSHPNFWQHKAAAALHGWADHEHHAGAPIQLTGDDYYAALVAASEPKPQKVVEKAIRDGKEVDVERALPAQYVPHFPALSPHGHLAKQFKAFEASSHKS